MIRTVQVVLLLSLTVLASCDGPCVSITDPVNGAKVGMRPLVRGRVCHKDSVVFLVVHPVEADDYWVQYQATVESDGGWQARPYIGEDTPAHVGKAFELRAVAGSKLNLKEGQKLPAWPSGEALSTVVNVTRE